MIRLELKKCISSLVFILSVLLLYVVFLLGDSGVAFSGDETSTVLGAIWEKLHGNWSPGVASCYLVRMYTLWNGNEYLSVLLPVFCALPSVMNYLSELETGNKKWLLSRCSLRKYYLSKLLGNLVSGVLVALLAVLLYYVTLYIAYDSLADVKQEFGAVYTVITGETADRLSDVSYALIYGKLIKNVLYFCLYAAVSSSFVLWMAAWCRDKYFTLGATIFLYYFQNRIVQELQRKFIMEGSEKAGLIGDILNPVFLHTAGEYGFYEKKEWLALLVALLLILFHYLMAVLISKRRFDVSEG